MSSYFSTCIICYDKLDPQKNEDMTTDELKEEDDRNKTILQNFCTQFDIPPDHVPTSQWNFQCEPLPFCPSCQENVKNLNVLHEEMETAQNSITFLKNSIKSTILEHSISFTVQDGVIDGRVKFIRDFIVLGAQSIMPPPSGPRIDPVAAAATTTTTTTTNQNFDTAAVPPDPQSHDQVQGLNYDELSSHLQHRNNNNNNMDELNISNSEHNNRQVSESEISSSEDDDDLDTASVLHAASMAGSQKTINCHNIMHEEESSDDEWPTRKEQVKAVKLPEADLWSYSGYIFSGSNENGFKCACCPHPTIYKARCDIIRHMRLRHLKNARTHHCSACGMKFFRPARLRRHLKNVHNINTEERTAVYRASVATQANEYSPVSEVHSPIFHEPQSVLFCELCHAKFKKLQHLQLHRKQFHPIPPPGRVPKYCRPFAASEKGYHICGPSSDRRGHYSRQPSPSRSQSSLHSWPGHFSHPSSSDERGCHLSRQSSPTKGHHFTIPLSSERGHFSGALPEQGHPMPLFRDNHYPPPPANIYDPPSSNHVQQNSVATTASVACSSISIPETQNSILLLDHQDPRYDFPCQICNIQFPTDLQLQLHRIRAHTPPPIETVHYPIPPSISIDAIHPLYFECQFCDCMFKLKENFDKHVQQFHSEPPTTSITNNEEQNLINDTSNENNQTETVKNNKNNTRMIVLKENLEKIPCPTCGQEFEKPVRLRRHMRKVHDVGRWTFGPNVCRGDHSSASSSVGGQTSVYSPVSKSSSNSIVDVSPQCHFSCDDTCHEKFGSDEDLPTHLQQNFHPSFYLEKIESPSSPFRCVYCESDFILQENLIKHVEEFHSSSSPQSIPDNLDDFEEINLKSNQSGSSCSGNDDRRPFDCPHCTEKFGQDVIMTRHVVEVQKQSPMKSSASASSSSGPSSVATEVEPKLFEIHICKKCGKTYATGRSLRDHEIATHKFDPGSPPQRTKRKRRSSVVDDDNFAVDPTDDDQNEKMYAVTPEEKRDEKMAPGVRSKGRRNKKNKPRTKKKNLTMDTNNDDNGKENNDQFFESKSLIISYKRWRLRPCWVKLDGIIQREN